MDQIILRLDGAIVPKARPRGSEGRFVLPENYRNWKNGAIVDLRLQYHYQTIQSVSELEIVLHGKHGRSGDADNIAGSIMDALVQADVIANDNLKNIPDLVLRSRDTWCKKTPPIATIILKSPIF